MTAFYFTVSILLLVAAAARTDGAEEFEFKDPPPAPVPASNVHGKTVVVGPYKEGIKDRKLGWTIGLRNITKVVFEQLGDNRPGQKTTLKKLFYKTKEILTTAITPRIFFFALGVTIGSVLPVGEWSNALVESLKQFFDDLLFVIRGHGFSSKKEEEQPYHYASYPVNQQHRAKRSGFEEVVTDNVLDILTEMAGTVIEYVEELYL